MRVENLSTLYTISFTKPRLDPTMDGDFCVYFLLESRRSQTFVTDLALFVRALGRNFVKWSALGDPDHLGPGNPAHPALRDLAYSWDGVASCYGVLQFRATHVSVMNIRRNFHQLSHIFSPLCSHSRYEYFATGTFEDAEDTLLPLAFTEMEIAAQYVYSTNFFIFKNIAHSNRQGIM